MKHLTTLLLILPLLASAQFTETTYIQGIFVRPSNISYHDFDNDGFSDMIFTGGGVVSWAKNLGGQELWSTNKVIDFSDVIPRQMQVADLDGDDALDIALLATSDGQNIHLYWYSNPAAYLYNDTIRIDFIANPIAELPELSLDLADIDQDGDMDILVAARVDYGQSFAQILSYINDGQGNFSKTVVADFPAIRNPRDLLMHDLNQDGFPDILVSQSEELILYYENLGGNGFNPADTILYPDFYTISTFDVADLNGDGNDDIILGRNGIGQINWFEQSDSLNFDTEHILYYPSLGVNVMDIADIDNDNDLDIVFTSNGDYDLNYFLNDGNGNFGDLETILDDIASTWRRTLLVADADSDGDMDITYGGGHLNENMIFYNTDGAGNFGSGKVFSMAPGSTSEVFFTDVDNDGYKDFITRGYVPSEFGLAWTRYNPQYDIYEQSRFLDIATDLETLIVFDINNDGHDDVVYRGSSIETRLYWQINDGSGNFSAPSLIAFPIGTNIQLYSADLNGDGWTDIVVNNDGPQSIGIFWFANLGDAGGFAPHEYILENNANFLEFADMNGDGFIDILPVLNNINQVGWIKNNGGSFDPFEILIPDYVLSSWSEIIVDDFDGDNLLDIFTFASTAYFYKANGINTFDAPVTIPTQYLDRRKVQLFDYDSDGYRDLVYLYYTSEGTHAAWQRNTNGLNIFDEPEPIDWELEQNAYVFLFEDIDGDTDRDMVYGDFTRLLWKKNVSANGRIVAQSFYDENNNGTLDAEEPSLNNVSFQLTPDETIHFTANDQATQFFVHEGNYTLNAATPANWNLTTDSASYDIVFYQDTIITKMFGYYPNNIFTNITSSISSAPTRCGFTVPFWLNYTNEGTTTENGFVKLFPAERATYLSAYPAPDTIINDTLFWSFENLAPTHQQAIQLEYEIFDASFTGDSVSLVTEIYTFDENNVQTFSNDHHYTSEINCTYDPNDKQVKPIGLLEEHYTLIDDTLEYTVRFQNTGTDTAFNIIITDILDPDLDWSTFRVIASSHYMKTTLNPQTGELSCLFPDIMLPDSIVNEPLSHGFFKYRILATENIPDGTIIENYASIVFDENLPITTNTTINTMISSFAIDVQEEVNDPLCFGDDNGSILLQNNAILPVIYQWDNPNLNGATNTDLSAGSYQVTIINASGENLIKSFILENPPTLLATPTTTPQSESTLGSATVISTGGTPPYTYNWDTNPSQNTESIHDLDAGIYTVTVTDSNGCSFTSTVEVDFISATANQEHNFKFTIVPNPTDGNISIVFDGQVPQKCSLEIATLSGNVFYKEMFDYPKSYINLQTADYGLTPGIYLLMLNIHEERFYKKLVVLPR